ncbi:hypothetical protein AVEN_200674-1 [Araneus ventricosus]|uniref:Uncharacterized protein n=1 Tax=Araneus ventricosus TaxID=182803 RepID=A0A4Y2L8T6_ARAVE|nr:hypothetical protein AVEN_200674-1 [Araneus ventricosus]
MVEKSVQNAQIICVHEVIQVAIEMVKNLIDIVAVADELEEAEVLMEQVVVDIEIDIGDFVYLDPKILHQQEMMTFHLCQGLQQLMSGLQSHLTDIMHNNSLRLDLIDIRILNRNVDDCYVGGNHK